MKKLSFVLIAVLAAVTLLVVGCGGDEEASPTASPIASPTAAPTPEVTATPVVTPVPTASPAQVPQELIDLLGKTAEIEAVTFNYVMNAPGMPPDLTSEVLTEAGKTKTTTTLQGQTITTYTDYNAQEMCTCFEDTGQCMGMDFMQAPPEPASQSEMIVDYNPTIIGSETINGKDCLVIGWTDQGVETKWWVDKETGWPVKIEITSPQGTTVIEYTDLEFGDIPDSEFEFPVECES